MPDSADRPEREPDTGVPLDLAALDELTGGDRREMHSLLQDFLAARAIDLDDLDQACERGDAAQMARLAHKIHGVSTLIGAEEMARLAADLQRAAITGDRPMATASALRAALRSAVQRLRTHVRNDFSRG